MNYAIMMGNPADGFDLIGPFDNVADAMLYLQTERSKQDMWMVQLHPPAMTDVISTLMRKAMIDPDQPCER